MKQIVTRLYRIWPTQVTEKYSLSHETVHQQADVIFAKASTNMAFHFGGSKI
jgi:hypothetical protein